MNLIDTFIEVNLVKPENFLVVLETLTRIGVASKTDKKLYQSCHILHRKGRYYITHFKQMFMLDNKINNFTKSDQMRLHTIVKMLIDWNLITLCDTSNELLPMAPASSIHVIPFVEKKNWELIQKYNIGSVKNGNNNNN